MHYLKNYLSQRLVQELPGQKAHMKMASYKRASAEEVLQSNNEARWSAVLILLFQEKNSIHTVFIKRPKYKGVHSAQICLPGGGKEEFDNSLEETALRETQEEIGIDPQKLDLIGSLSNIYIPPSNYIVSPHIAFLNEIPDFIPNPKEVDIIIKVPISELFQEKNVKITSVNAGSFTLKVPCFDIDGHIIWGATAMILSEFCEVLSGYDYHLS